MNSVTIGIILIAIMLVLLFIGVPIGACMAISAFLGMVFVLTPNAALLKMASSPFETMTSYTYAVMPLFMLMAMLISTTGIGRDLYDFFYRTVGRLRGGLAMATVLACGIFAAISSSTSATALTIGLIALPEMRRAKYGDSLATGSVAAGGTLGILIPPSGIFIIYGIMTQQSISRLFIAGIIPGIILIALFCGSIALVCRKNPAAGPAGPKFSGKEMLQALGKCIDVIILLVVVMGGMFASFFTPSEAAAVGCAGAIVITLARRRLTWKNFKEAIHGTLKASGIVYMIMIGAFILNYFMALTNIPTALANFIMDMGLSKTMVCVAIIIVYLILGCFLDALAMILLTMPVFFPIIQAMSIDPIWFGVIVTLSVGMACLTPPVGMNVYVVKGIAKHVPIDKIFGGAMPFLACQLILVVLMFLFPQMATWLPSLISG